MESKITAALRQERIDGFENAIRHDEGRLSEFRQWRKAERETKLIDAERSDVTGY